MPRACAPQQEKPAHRNEEYPPLTAKKAHHGLKKKKKSLKALDGTFPLILQTMKLKHKEFIGFVQADHEFLLMLGFKVALRSPDSFQVDFSVSAKFFCFVK